MTPPASSLASRTGDLLRPGGAGEADPGRSAGLSAPAASKRASRSPSSSACRRSIRKRPRDAGVSGRGDPVQGARHVGPSLGEALGGTPRAGDGTAEAGGHFQVRLGRVPRDPPRRRAGLSPREQARRHRPARTAVIRTHWVKTNAPPTNWGCPGRRSRRCRGTGVRSTRERRASRGGSVGAAPAGQSRTLHRSALRRVSQSSTNICHSSSDVTRGVRPNRSIYITYGSSTSSSLLAEDASNQAGPCSSGTKEADVIRKQVVVAVLMMGLTVPAAAQRGAVNDKAENPAAQRQRLSGRTGSVVAWAARHHAHRATATAPRRTSGRDHLSQGQAAEGRHRSTAR